MKNSLHQELQAAFLWRKNLGFLDQTEAARIFYGPGESSSELRSLAIDLFQEHAWITQWEQFSESSLNAVVQFLRLLSPWGTPIQSVVLMKRTSKPTKANPAQESDQDVVTLWGNPPDGRFSVQEFGTPYLIQFSKTKHPGLFLDHAPLRRWLLTSQTEKRVLNLFAYTGSLSVAAAKGGASHVTTLDLSKATLDWAKENWENASLPEANADFIFGDALEWLPRLQKKGVGFDTILCDPPSFSRSKNGTFSTQKDSQRLHQLIFPLLKPGGVLMTSINSENISEESFLKDIHLAAQKTKTPITLLKRIDLPETFPTHSRGLKYRYLKGFLLLRN